MSKVSRAIILALSAQNIVLSQAAHFRGAATQYDITSDADFDAQRQQLLASGSSKCAGAVSTGRNNCEALLWAPTGDHSLPCYSYGGTDDPCSLNYQNDMNGAWLYKDPSNCKSGDTFYLWDEPDTNGSSYTQAAQDWLKYSQKWASQLATMRSRGINVTTPLARFGGHGVVESNLRAFFVACGGACTDESNPAYIGVIAANPFCGRWNNPDCRDGATFAYNELASTYIKSFNLPVYITNWSYEGEDATVDKQVNAMMAIENFFPDGESGVVKRLYWLSAIDYPWGHTTGYLTNSSGGKSLGQIFEDKCDSL